MDVSVIVCTRNRADSLARCLASIAADPSKASAEILVVDDFSRDHTQDVIRAASLGSRRWFRSMWGEGRGHSRARNRGAKYAHGTVLMFTDDDVQVQPGWIDAMAAVFDDPSVGAAGGRIIPTYLCDRPAWLTDEEVFNPLTLTDYGPEPFLYADGHWPIGANMAIRSSLLGPDPFAVHLGHTGSAGIGFDEFQIMERLGREHKIAYTPDAVVWHMLDENRVTRAVAKRTLFQHGFGLARYQRMVGEPAPPLRRRLVDLADAWRYVRRARASDCAAELRAWRGAGEQTEWLLGAGAPWLANWCAAHLSRT